MVMADLVCIPAALWTAMTLKEGTPLHTSPGDSWLYVAAILSSVPVFARLGLYRAIVRFLGTRALLAVIAGVSVSVALLLIVNQLLLGKGVHISSVRDLLGARADLRRRQPFSRARADPGAATRLGSRRDLRRRVAGAQVASALLGGGPITRSRSSMTARACTAAASTASRYLAPRTCPR